MRKKYLLIVVAVIIIIGIYMNLSYSHIYKEIGGANLKSSDMKQTYLIGDDLQKESDKNLSKNLKYVALGDSLTAGVGVDDYEQAFPYLIAQKISENKKTRVTLKTEAFPGFKTQEVKDKLLDQVISDKPDIVTVLVGVNDIHGNISKSDFKSNYEEILNRLALETTAKIYVVNLPFIGGTGLLRFPYNFYFDWQTKQFNEVIKNLSETYNAEYIDLYSQTVEEFKREGNHYAADSFHPSAKGYAQWAQIIYDGINQ
jgi:lysophospholipase L1-like esterase